MRVVLNERELRAGFECERLHTEICLLHTEVLN